MSEEVLGNEQKGGLVSLLDIPREIPKTLELVGGMGVGGGASDVPTKVSHGPYNRSDFRSFHSLCVPLVGGPPSRSPFPPLCNVKQANGDVVCPVGLVFVSTRGGPLTCPKEERCERVKIGPVYPTYDGIYLFRVGIWARSGDEEQEVRRHCLHFILRRSRVGRPRENVNVIRVSRG